MLMFSSGQANNALLISGATLDILNRFVIINFDPNVYHSSGGGLLASDLAVTFAQNGGVATACSISSVSQVDGSALVGGETEVKVNISITGNPSGVETIEIKPSAAGSYRDSDDNYCSANDSTGVITLELELDPMYKAVILAELTANESTPARPQRLVENEWFVDARAAGWLTELDGFHLASYTYDHECYNFVTGTKDAAIVGAPVLTQYLGQIGATGGYIDFNWNPSADGINFLQDDNSCFVVITNNGQSAGLVFGARGTGGGVNFGHVRILPRNVSDQAACSTGVNNAGNEIVVAGITDSEGVYNASRNAASGANAVKFYKDGVEIGTDVDTSSTPTERDFYGNAENPNDGAPTVNVVHQVLLWAWGSNLRSHVASINTISAALKTGLEALVPNIIADKLYSWCGQSLMDRAELLSALDAGQTATYVTNGEYLVANGYDANCYVWWDDEWQPINPGVNGVDKDSGGVWFGPLYAFALAEAAKYPGENLYFIHQAVGGTGMKTASGANDWLPGGTYSSMYETWQREYNNAIAALTSVTEFMPFYWGQGEADSNVDEARSLEYEVNEQTMIASILADTSHTDLIVMQIYDNLPPAIYPWASNVIAAKAANFAGGEYGALGALINVDDLPRQADSVHMTNTSCITFAQRMSAAYP